MRASYRADENINMVPSQIGDALMPSEWEMDRNGFLAILQDAEDHEVYAGQCYCPDTWQEARELVAESDAVSDLLENDESLAARFDRFVAYGESQGWQDWSYVGGI